MREHFPNMYLDLRNYYRHIKLNRERKSNKTLVVDNEKLFNKRSNFLFNLFTNNEDEKSRPKILWKRKYNDNELKSKFYLKICVFIKD